MKKIGGIARNYGCGLNQFVGVAYHIGVEQHGVPIGGLHGFWSHHLRHLANEGPGARQHPDVATPVDDHLQEQWMQVDSGQLLLPALNCYHT